MKKRIACAVMSVVVGLAQNGTGDWMTSAYDAQRSSWLPGDGKISLKTMSKPGFELVWKVKINNAARQLNSLTPPALLDFFIGHRGFRALGFFGGSSNHLTAIDLELSRLEWDKAIGQASASPGTFNCPGGMTSAVTRPTASSYPPAFFGRGAGRGTAAKSGVGLPHEGAVTIRATPPPQKKAQAARPIPATAAAAANPFAARIQWVMAVTGDGKLHMFYVSNGEEPNAPIPFLPPNANAHGLISFDGTAYIATTNNCGGVDDGVWALDVATKKVTSWKSGKGVAGTAGPAVAPDGTLYAAAGSELTALAPKTLAKQGSYKTGGAEFTSSPVVFDFKGRTLIAATTNDGRIHLADTASIDKSLAVSAPFSSPNYSTGSLTSWRDEAGTRWILAAAGGKPAGAGFASNGTVTSGTLVAWKLVEKNGGLAFEPGWTSRDLMSPLPPVVINGVAFVLSSGEFRSNDPNMSAAQRAQRSSNAVLYALDPLSGRELWNSGKTITSFVHSGGLSGGSGRVFVSGYDGTQYAFSFPIEH